jgi:thiamine-phosphate pyrophosphorylase
MPVPDSFGFYAILTDPLRGYDYCTRLCVEHEIAFVQLRMKDAPDDAVIKTAEMMQKTTAGSKTKLIIDDNPHIAKQIQADGVHVGQNDMPYAEARRIMGEDAIVGLSTHSVAQMQKACALRPDYAGIGPVYATPTKKYPDPVIGLDGMKSMLAAATIPAVAIGGITLENLPLVLAAGAQNFCMVRPLMQAREPEKVMKEVLKIYRDFLQ